jgi:hypothetical protein
MRGFAQYRSSAIVLLAANAVPLLGVLFLGWDAFSVVALYWAENVIIGAVNVLKMITCSPDSDQIDWSKLASSQQLTAIRAALDSGEMDQVLAAHHALKLFLVPFFIVHYGMFCLVHGVFVLVMFGRNQFVGAPLAVFANFARMLKAEHLLWAVAALAASHLYSFAVNYIGRGEYRRTAAPILMFQPYGRVVVLHVAILFGGFLVMAIGNPMGLLVLLVLGKTALDLEFHFREHDRNAVGRKTASPPEEVLSESPQT